MPALDYYAVANAIKSILEASADLAGVTVVVEKEHTFTAGAEPWIGIYVERRDPSPSQYLDAGQSTRYQIRFSIWVWCMSIEDTERAIKVRNELVGKVEKVLMANRTLNNLVSMSWLLGGELPSGRLSSENDEAIYLSGGETILVAETTTSTV